MSGNGIDDDILPFVDMTEDLEKANKELDKLVQEKTEKEK